MSNFASPGTTASILVGATLFLSVPSAFAQTADQLVTQGRAELRKQTPAGLRKADELFANALAKNSDHAAANVLKSATGIALMNSEKPTISTLSLLGIGTNDPNPFDAEYTFTVDTRGRLVPADTAETKLIRSWGRSAATSQIDAALGRLAKVRDKNFLLVLSAREASNRPTRIDYGDVHGARFLMLALKAISSLSETYNTDASFHTFYQMLRRGELDLETILNRYPLLLARAPIDQRAASKSHFLAAVRAYELASPVLWARATQNDSDHLLSLDSKQLERDLRNSLRAMVKSFSSSQTLKGVTFNLGRAVTTTKTPRSLLGRVRGNAFVPGKWPDPTLDGILQGPGISSLLQEQADEITDSLNSSYPTPTITSSGEARGTVGRAFKYQITSSREPFSFSTGRLPGGLNLARNGLISGNPTVAGTYSVEVTANTETGRASRILKMMIDVRR